METCSISDIIDLDILDRGYGRELSFDDGLLDDDTRWLESGRTAPAAFRYREDARRESDNGRGEFDRLW